MTRKAKDPKGGQSLATNRAASYEYHLQERYEAGIALTGPEVKSCRSGRVNLKDAYVRIEHNEALLQNMHISPYAQAASETYDPTRPRKLLLHAHEIRRLARETDSESMTIVPTRMYLKEGRIKVEIAVAKGKKAYDKRETARREASEREMRRARGTVRGG